jgi:hypothetical protein
MVLNRAGDGCVIVSPTTSLVAPSSLLLFELLAIVPVEPPKALFEGLQKKTDVGMLHAELRFMVGRSICGGAEDFASSTAGG